MSGERSKRIGDLGEDFVSRFLGPLMWQFRAGAFDIEHESEELTTESGRKRKTFGIDGVYSYRDPYAKREIAVILSVKTYSWNVSEKKITSNSLADLLRKQVTELYDKLEVVRRSVDFRSKTGLEQTPFEPIGLLVHYVHDTSFDADLLRDALKKISDTRGDGHGRVFLLCNDRLESIYSILKDLRTIATSEGAYEFHHFNLEMRAAPDAPWTPYATLETLFSKIILTRVKEERRLYFQGSIDQASVRALTAALARYQVFREPNLTLIPTSRVRADEAPIKRMIFENHLVVEGKKKDIALNHIDLVPPAFSRVT